MYISIIIPLYNKEKRIYHTIESVLSQSFQNFELIVVDDGSTDNSVEIVRSINDARLRLICKSNGGPSSARNMGVREAKYEWIVFLDADDEILDGALGHFAHLMQNNPHINMFVCDFLYERNGKRRKHSFFYEEGIKKNNFRGWFFDTMMPCQGSTMYRKELLLNNPYSETLRRYEDAEMLFALMRTQRIYTSRRPSFVYHLDFAAASKGRKDIREDYLGYLDFKGKTMWEKIVLFDLYKQAKKLYPDQVKIIYKDRIEDLKLKYLYVSACIARFFLKVVGRIRRTFYLEKSNGGGKIVNI